MSGLRNFLVCTSLLASLQSTFPPQGLAQHTAGSPEDAARFIDQNIGLTAQPITLPQLRARLRAQKESSREVPNLHVPGRTDRIVVLGDGKGIEVEAYVPATGPALIERITVTAAERKLPAGLQIGRSSLDDMYAALGENAQNEKGPGGAFAKRYFNLERTASALAWFDRGERLAGVEWRFSGD